MTTPTPVIKIGPCTWSVYEYQAIERITMLWVEKFSMVLEGAGILAVVRVC